MSLDGWPPGELVVPLSTRPQVRRGCVLRSRSTSRQEFAHEMPNGGVACCVPERRTQRAFRWSGWNQVSLSKAIGASVHATRIRSWNWSRLSNAPDTDAEHRRFRITHRFHPLFGRGYDLIDYRHSWGEDRVVYVDEQGDARILPASWTSAATDDPFTVVSAGRSYWRVADLLELAAVIREAKRSGGEAFL